MLDYTFERQIELERKDAWKEGFAEGYREGFNEVIDAYFAIIARFLEENDTVELKHFLADKDYREALVYKYRKNK